VLFLVELPDLVSQWPPSWSFWQSRESNRALDTVHHFHAVSVWTTEVFVQSPIEGTIPQANQTNFTQDIEQVRQ
jgi:hypothetical protein